MYTDIINNNKVSFKEIEQEIFRRCCEAARNATADILKAIDDSLAKSRDKSVYRDKEEELLELAQIYYDSICANGEHETEGEKVKELKEYLENHKGKLKSYKSVIRDLPEAPEGIVYKNMGVQENQNCTLITLRMKGKRKRWAARSANRMVKLLYYRENADLKEAVERYTDIEVWTETVKEKLPEPLSAGRVPKVDGKGKNKYYEIMNVHLPITESSNS